VLHVLLLTQSRVRRQDVTEKLLNASETNKKINEACEEYRPVAHRATLIYFLIAEFAVVNCMYQTSLAQVLTATQRESCVLCGASIHKRGSA
jgi:hypothetical protein